MDKLSNSIYFIAKREIKKAANLKRIAGAISPKARKSCNFDNDLDNSKIWHFCKSFTVYPSVGN